MSKSKASGKTEGAEAVEAYLDALVHPLKAEMAEVRRIIMNTSNLLSERIKWAAPSFYCGEDLATFNHRNEKVVQLVFHHPSIVDIPSEWLEGNYKDRRLMHFTDMEDVHRKAGALQEIFRQLLQRVNQPPV